MDSETPTSIRCSRCPHLYDPDEDLEACHENNLCGVCNRAALEQGALDAGIPLSVIRGERKITDFYSREYVNRMAGYVPEEGEE